MNVDRTARNTNMLIWNKELWLIDHGASLYFHHSWSNWQQQAVKPFVQVKDHVLLKAASQLEAADELMRTLITTDIIGEVVSKIPDEWLTTGDYEESPSDVKAVYTQFLTSRLQSSSIFLNEALHARKSII
jgi:hypothetical protein